MLEYPHNPISSEKVGYEQNIFFLFSRYHHASYYLLPWRETSGRSLPQFRDFRSSIGVLAQNLEFLLLSLLSSLLSCFCCCCRCFVVVISVLDRHSRTTATEPCSLSVSTFQVGHCHNFGSFGPIYWCHRSRFGIFFSLLSSLLLGFCCCCRCFVVVIFVLDRRWRTIATEPCSLLVCSWLIIVDFQFSTPDCWPSLTDDCDRALFPVGMFVTNCCWLSVFHSRLFHIKIYLENNLTTYCCQKVSLRSGNCTS